jgi:hypothetical protein
MTRAITFRIGATLACTMLAGALAPACLDRPIEPIEPRTTGRYESTLTQSRVDKIDILLSIDDSGSMADKQAMLAAAVPRLVTALANPPCIDDAGGVASQPGGPLEECPAGSFREFEPVLDIHIGIVSSSLGGAGGAACPTNNDKGHLIARIDPENADLRGETFEDLGFLVWSPEDPAPAPGEFNDVAALGAQLELMIVGTGQEGCGYEAQLESWYRFLIDPRPYDQVVYDAAARNEGKVTPNTLEGVDEVVLAQRAAFLRPDSLVAIVQLSDENDCSFRHAGYGWLTAQVNLLSKYKARAECKTNLNDPCCLPCGVSDGACPADPTCDEAAPPGHGLANLTCFDQKRRFGMDLLHPPDRYVDALTKPEIADRDGNVVDNPLFVGEDGRLRSTDRVFFAGIVGLPWQTVARNPDDIGEGLQNAKEMVQNGTWAKLLPDPTTGAPPTDPHMIESIDPREGLPGPGAGYLADPINGHDYNVHLTSPTGGYVQGLLQHACIFPLAEPVDCAVQDCDCDAASANNAANNPLCQRPDGSYSTTHQYFAKAYPSSRQLQVLRGIGDQAIVASICPAEPIDQASPHYGYLPAIEALIERLKQTLKGPCLNRSLTPDAKRQVACIILEGRKLGPSESCSCELAGRRDVRPEYTVAVAHALEHPAADHYEPDCFCEIEQLQDGALTACQDDTSDAPAVGNDPIHGWCYIDHDHVPTIGNPKFVDHCESGERRTIRFVGEGEPALGALAFVTCQPEN